MWIRKQIDIAWPDLLRGFGFCIKAMLNGNRLPSRTILLDTQRCPDTETDSSPPPKHRQETVEFLSVRSGFDCVLKALDWPHGSEVLFSGLTIPDMPRIAREHGCMVIPIDISPETLEPNIEQIRQSITPNTRAIIAAHLFGSQTELAEIANIASEHDLLLIEDCAQSYVGNHMIGSTLADISMFSFGPIKTNTSLGGAMLYIRCPRLRQKIQANHLQLPIQTEFAFLKRLLKYSMLKGIDSRFVVAILFSTAQLLRMDFDRVVSSMAKGFSGQNFFDQIRRQPSAALRHLLSYRLSSFDQQKIAIRAKQGAYLASQLNEGAFILGRASDRPTYWVFPILVHDPQTLVLRLNAAGFDATTRSSLSAVESPPRDVDAEAEIAKTQSRSTPANVQEMLKHIVFLPLHPKMSQIDLDRMAQVVNTTCSQSGLHEKQFNFELTENRFADDQSNRSFSPSVR